MKLLTLNAHSLQGDDAPQRLENFVRGVLDMRPDLIALQESSQSRSAAPLDGPGRQGFVRASGGIPLRRDNHTASAARLLREAGVPCSWSWLPVKLGYGRYDEGLALLSLSAPVAETDALLISARDDYRDWRTRKVLGVRLEGREDWFYSVHLGWWGDEDPFRDQWARLEAGLAEKRARGPVWLLGDFNSPAHVRGQGHDLVESSGWRDTFQRAARRDGGGTVRGAIDGWRDRLEEGVPEDMRIDYIWCSQDRDIALSQVVFDGGKHPVVSDHFGVLAEMEEP